MEDELRTQFAEGFPRQSRLWVSGAEWAGQVYIVLELLRWPLLSGGRALQVPESSCYFFATTRVSDGAGTGEPSAAVPWLQKCLLWP